MLTEILFMKHMCGGNRLHLPFHSTTDAVSLVTTQKNVPLDDSDFYLRSTVILVFVLRINSTNTKNIKNKK